MNAGDKGASDRDVDPVELTRRRAAEVHAAADVLGLAGVDLLGLPDGEVTNDLDLRGRLVALVRRHRPDIVVCPDPTAVFFGDSYVNHRDHREVGWATVDTVAPAAGSPLYFPEAGEAHQVGALLLSGTFAADAWVDVGDAIETKIRAVACHESRMGGDPDLVAELLRARTAETGAEAGVAPRRELPPAALRLNTGCRRPRGHSVVAHRIADGRAWRAFVRSAGLSAPSRASSVGLAGPAVLDRAPLAHGPQGEHGHDRHAARADERADQAGRPRGGAAVARALQVDERPADQPAAQPADEDGHEGEHPRRGGRQRARGVVVVRLGGGVGGGAVGGVVCHADRHRRVSRPAARPPRPR